LSFWHRRSFSIGVTITLIAYQVVRRRLCTRDLLVIAIRHVL
jgi:hypothetical protein